MIQNQSFLFEKNVKFYDSKDVFKRKKGDSTITNFGTIRFGSKVFRSD